MPALQRFVAALLFLSAAPLAAQESGTIQPAEGCEAAPADAILELPAPVGYWARIVCTPTGHTLAPASGDAWQIKEDSRASGIEAGSGDGGGPNDAYFIAAAVNETSGSDLAWAKQLFAQKAGEDLTDGVRETYALDLTDNRTNLIRIYIFAGADGPLAGVACLRSCENTVTVIVTHAEPM
jgi:hypothetical protein